MRKTRGLIALIVAVCLGLFAANAASWYLNKHKKKATETRREIVTSPPKKQISYTEAIPVGMRVFSVRVDETSGVSQKLRKGDMVDIAAITSLGDKKGRKMLRVILQNIKILSINPKGDQKNKNSGRRDKTRTVALLLKPEDATILAVAVEASSIKLLVRNPKDTSDWIFEDVVFSPLYGIKRFDKTDCDLNDRIQPDMRAVTIKIADTDGICGALKPGDHVDVIITSPYSRFVAGGKISPGAQGQVSEYRMVSRTLLQNIEILTTGKVLETGIVDDMPVKRVTLLVTPAEAEKIAVLSDASKKNMLRLVIRNKNDNKRTRTKGQYLADLLTKKRQYHRIDVIRGSDVNQREFFK